MRRLGAATLALGLVSAGIAVAAPTVLAWSGPPAVSPLCAPNSTEYAWQISFGAGESNYNVDISFNDFSTSTEVLSSSVPFDIYTQQTSGDQLYARWDSDTSAGTTGPVTADSTLCESPTLTTQTVPGSPVSIGTSVYDTATISWITTADVDATVDTAEVAGTISYGLYSDSLCTDLVTSLTPTDNTVTGGSVPNSNSYTFNSAGTWYFQATYSFDSTSVSSSCTSEEIVVTPNTPTITTETEPGSPVAIGTSVHDTAALTGATSNAGGTVSYGLYSNSSCSDLVKDLTPTDNTVTDGSVPDSRPYTFNSAGSWYFQATYSGDSNNAGPVSSSCRSEKLVVALPPAITTKLSTSSLVLGYPVDAPGQVRDTVTVTGEPDVNGFDVYVHLYKESGTPPTPDANSIATWVVPLNSNGMATTPWYMPESAGTFCFMASFKGDANDTPISTDTCEVLTVTKFPASLTTVPSSPSTTGLVTTLSDTADTTIYPTMPAEGGSGDYGTVVFTLYSDSDCHAVVPGGVTSAVAIAYNGTTFEAKGTLDFSAPLAPGTYYWIGAYGGNYDNLAYTSSCGEPIVVPVSGAGGGVLAASTTSPVTGADLFGPGLAGVLALLVGGLMVLVGNRLLRLRAR